MIPDKPTALNADLSSSRQVSGSSSRWLLLAVALGATLAPINSTMIAVALPRIQSDFGVSVTETTWLVTIYLVAMAVGQPVGGRLGDIFGRRTVYLVGLAGFGLASAGCAFAPGLNLLIVFRTLQGLAGALTFPNGSAIIRESVPEGKRGSAFGALALSTGIAAALGPPLGGVLVHQFDWQAIFWVNLPIVALALLLGIRCLPERLVSTAKNRPRFDYLGTLLLTLSLGAVVVIPAAIRLHHRPIAVGAALFSVLAMVAFAWWEMHHPAPVVDVRLFGSRAFTAACGSVGLSNLVMYTVLLSLPLYLEKVRGHDERSTGLTLAAMSAFAALWGPIGGRVTDVRGKRLPAVVGASVFFLGTAALALVIAGGEIWKIVLALALLGLGLGIAAPPVQTAAVEAAPLARVGSAAGVYSTSRYLGSVTGSTILALLFATNPGAGDVEPFKRLFIGLAIVAGFTIFVNSRIAE